MRLLSQYLRERELLYLRLRSGGLHELGGGSLSSRSSPQRPTGVGRAGVCGPEQGPGGPALSVLSGRSLTLQTSTCGPCGAAFLVPLGAGNIAAVAAAWEYPLEAWPAAPPILTPASVPADMNPNLWVDAQSTCGGVRRTR